MWIDSFHKLLWKNEQKIDRQLIMIENDLMKYKLYFITLRRLFKGLLRDPMGCFGERENKSRSRLLHSCNSCHRTNYHLKTILYNSMYFLVVSSIKSTLLFWIQFLSKISQKISYKISIYPASQVFDIDFFLVVISGLGSN